jgi:uncharacterized protein (DUF111 family)
LDAVRKLFLTNLGDFEASDTDSSIIMVAKDDFITLNTDKVYRVEEVVGNGTVRCASPANPVNDPIVITLELANKALSRQYK